MFPELYGVMIDGATLAVVLGHVLYLAKWSGKLEERVKAQGDRLNRIDKRFDLWSVK